ncbi:DUF2157 domain-containing protein [Pseudalkalibacillus sp. SCS-8]|uniref:DUF2157 domain-containing protein n=1 Tax=Pseudalkalibacillus nanhaiensis TaxID=3115291 RepID=UPI0032DA813E
MNERKWLRKEGPKWVEQGYIQKEQLEGIYSMYEKKRNNLLPILASILIGLGILTFIASNWGQMSDWFRLTLIWVAIAGFHLTGGHYIQKGSEHLGSALIGIGTITFGAGIFLVAQMFHIVSYNATAFILWTASAILTYFVFPNRYFYLLSLFIGTSGILYSFISFQAFSHVLAFLVIVGIGYLTFKEDSRLLYYLYSAAIIITSITFIVVYEYSYFWMTIVFLILYGINELMKSEKAHHSFKDIGILGILAVTFIHVFIMEEYLRYNDLLVESVPYLIVLFVLVSLIGMMKKMKSSGGWTDLILFTPLYLLGETADVLYLLLAFGYSLYVLIQGYQREEPSMINRGTLLFLISTLVAYIQLAWAFLPKSLFFLAGGILLFLLSWYLEKRRRVMIHNAKGGRHDA